MRLKKLRITNYKIIHDSGLFELPDVTCLVGKNESGKSAICEALYKLKPVTEAAGNFEPIYDYPQPIRDVKAYADRFRKTAPNCRSEAGL